jgi:NAD(P)H-nitrite reductase large subunit
MRKFMKLLIAVLILLSSVTAQEPKVVEATFKASGNCGQCKTRIENALKIKEVKYAKWDKKSKIVTLAYLSPDISLDSLQRRVAAVGHDTEKYKASDAVYSNLPGCCLYRGPDKTH